MSVSARLRLHFTAALGLVGLMTLVGNADTYTWTGAAGDNNYSNQLNWLPIGVP